MTSAAVRNAALELLNELREIYGENGIDPHNNSALRAIACALQSWTPLPAGEGE